MKQLIQTTGIVDISENDSDHMSALLDYVTATTKKIISGS